MKFFVLAFFELGSSTNISSHLLLKNIAFVSTMAQFTGMSEGSMIFGIIPCVVLLISSLILSQPGCGKITFSIGTPRIFEFGANVSGLKFSFPFAQTRFELETNSVFSLSYNSRTCFKKESIWTFDSFGICRDLRISFLVWFVNNDGSIDKHAKAEYGEKTTFWFLFWLIFCNSSMPNLFKESMIGRELICTIKIIRKIFNFFNQIMHSILNWIQHPLKKELNYSNWKTQHPLK